MVMYAAEDEAEHKEDVGVVEDVGVGVDVVLQELHSHNHMKVRQGEVSVDQDQTTHLTILKSAVF